MFQKNDTIGYKTYVLKKEILMLEKLIRLFPNSSYLEDRKQRLEDYKKELDSLV